MGELQNKFQDLAEELLPDISNILRDTIKDEFVKLPLRLKAAEMILSRSIPELKAVEHKGLHQPNITYISPHYMAIQVLENSNPKKEVPSKEGSPKPEALAVREPKSLIPLTSQEVVG